MFRTVVYTDSPDAFKYYRFVDAGNANEFDSFIAKCKELSFYDTGVTAASVSYTHLDVYKRQPVP